MELCLTSCLLSLPILLLGLVLLSYLPRLKRRLRFSNLPPGPWTLPVVGYLPFLDQQTAAQTLDDDAKEYGPIFGFQVGSKYLVVLTGYDAIKECYNREEFMGRPSTLFQMGNGQNSILDMEGLEWREHKKFFMNTLRLLGIGSKDYQSAVMGQIDDIMTSLRSQQGNDVQILNEVELAINNSTYQYLYGKKFEPKHPMIKLQQDFAFATMKLFGVNGMKTFFPWLGYLATFAPDFQRALKKLQKLDAVVKEELKEHRQGLNPEEPRDFVDYFLLQMEKPGQDKYFTGSSLLGTAKGLLVGGSDTTRLSVSWFFLTMAAFPQVQEKVQEEIDSVVGREREPSYSDRVAMPYTEAAIYESMRYKNLIHFNILRSATVDTKLCGYDIPKDTIIVHHMTSQFHNEAYFERPNEFDPTRFLSHDQTKLQLPEHFAPFSYGKRNCPGEKVAMTNMFLFGVRLLQQFQILPPEGGVNLDVNVVFNNRPTHPYARFQPRD